MAHTNKVLRSIETPDGDRCVDLFVRGDGSFGFEEYRREPEDGRGWYPIGSHGTRKFSCADTALDEAQARVPWLTDVLVSR